MFEGLNCLNCGEVDTQQLRFVDDTFVCTHCDAEICRSDISTIILEWQKVLAWTATCPDL